MLEKSRHNLKDFILTWPNFVAKVNFCRFGNKIGWITSIMKRKTLPLSYTNRVLGVKFRWLNFEGLFKFHVELLTKPPFYFMLKCRAEKISKIWNLPVQIATKLNFAVFKPTLAESRTNFILNCPKSMLLQVVYTHKTKI